LPFLLACALAVVFGHSAELIGSSLIVSFLLLAIYLLRHRDELELLRERRAEAAREREDRGNASMYDRLLVTPPGALTTAACLITIELAREGDER
jgi:hypothetical protein